MKKTDYHRSTILNGKSQIRELRLDDLQEVSSLWNEAMAGAYQRPTLRRDELESLTFNSQTFERQASFVAKDNGKTLAVIISFADQQFESDGYWHMIVAGWIGALIVSPLAKGKGLDLGTGFSS